MSEKTDPPAVIIPDPCPVCEERERHPLRVIDVPDPPPDALFERVREEMDREMAKATGPGVAKVEPLTAFERLEAEVERLRGWPDVRGIVAAFDAWKVAREAEPPDPDQERTPAPLTEAEAQRWFDLEYNAWQRDEEDKRSVRTLAADIIKRASRHDIPADVRPAKDGGGQ